MLAPYNPLDKSTTAEEPREKTRKYPYSKEQVVTTNGKICWPSTVVVHVVELKINNRLLLKCRGESQRNTDIFHFSNSNPVLSMFMTYYQIFNMRNTMGATGGAGIAYLSSPPRFLLCNVLWTIILSTWRPLFVVCHPLTSHIWIVSSEPAWPNEPKLNRKHLWNVLYKDRSLSSQSINKMVAICNSCFWLVNF